MGTHACPWQRMLTRAELLDTALDLTEVTQLAEVNSHCNTWRQIPHLLSGKLII